MPGLPRLLVDLTTIPAELRGGGMRGRHFSLGPWKAESQRLALAVQGRRPRSEGRGRAGGRLHRAASLGWPQPWGDTAGSTMASSVPSPVSHALKCAHWALTAHTSWLSHRADGEARVSAGRAWTAHTLTVSPSQMVPCKESPRLWGAVIAPGSL